MISNFIAMSGTSFENLILFINEHQYLIAVLTPLLTGEVSIHIFGILSGSGDISLLTTVIAVASIIVFDTIIYAAVKVAKKRSSTLERIRKIKLFTKIEKLFQKYEERYNKHPIVLLFAIKLMPMTKITVIFFSLCQKASIIRFVLWDIIITTIWATVIFLPGWFVGKEFLTQEAGNRLSNFALYLLLIMAAIILFGDWVDKVIMRITNNIANTLDRTQKKTD